MYVHVVQAEIGVQTGGGGGCWGGWRMHWRHRSVTVGRRERTYARSMFMALVTRGEPEVGLEEFCLGQAEKCLGHQRPPCGPLVFLPLFWATSQ